MHGAVFLDRDGTLIEDKDYLHRPEDVVYYPGAIDALKELQHSGLLLFIVTNQSGVGRGYFTHEDVARVHRKIESDLSNQGVRLSHIYTAMEAPDAPSRGRKPSPQFLFDARDEFDLRLDASYMIGDKLIDLECGWNAGLRRSLLVRTGYGASVERKHPQALERGIAVADLADAARWILEDRRRLPPSNLSA